MPERDEFEQSGEPSLPEPEEIIQELSQTLGLNSKRQPDQIGGYPEEALFPEEAPTPDGRYIARSCLLEICHLVLKYTPAGERLLLSPADVYWLYEHLYSSVEEAWDMPEPMPAFTLTHLLGACKRQIAELQELARFEETSRYNGAIAFLRDTQQVIGQAVLKDDPQDKADDSGL